MAGTNTLEGRNGIAARKVLRKVSKVLEKEGIPYILEAGTLLGVVRENRLLPWDNDMDITITRQYEKKLLNTLWKMRLRGLKAKPKYYERDLKYFKQGDLRIIKVRYRNNLPFFKARVMLDIFIKRKIENEYFWTVGVKAPVLKSVPERFYDELGKIEFDGKSYSVPKDHEGYLEEHYGKDWRTPVKEWDFRTSDNSVKEFL